MLLDFLKINLKIADIGVISWISILAVVLRTVSIVIATIVAILDPAAHYRLGLAVSKVLRYSVVSVRIGDESILRHVFVDFIEVNFYRLVFFVKVCPSVKVDVIELPASISNLGESDCGIGETLDGQMIGSIHSTATWSTRII